MGPAQLATSAYWTLRGASAFVAGKLGSTVTHVLQSHSMLHMTKVIPQLLSNNNNNNNTNNNKAAFLLMMNIVKCFEHLVLSVCCGLPNCCLLNPLMSPEDRKCTLTELID